MASWHPNSIEPPVMGVPPLVSDVIRLDSQLPAVPDQTNASQIHINPNAVADEEDVLPAVRAAPPWLISLLIHMAVLIVLALVLIPSEMFQSVNVELTFSDTFGNQLDEDVAEFSLSPSEFDEQIQSITDMPMTDDPLAASPVLQSDLAGTLFSSDTPAPTIGIALSGREAGMKEVLLSAYGGNRLTEEAVQNGLDWLRKNQLKDGTWSLTGPYSSAGLNDDRTSATAMALLAFQGAGHTHQTGMHQKAVAKGWDALLAMQRPNGDFWRGSVLHHRLYAQAQATIAICELYGMTQDSRFRDPAQRAIDYAVEIQDVRGGWRYTPGSDSDTSVTGWFVMALQSAQMADLKVPQRTLDNVARFLDSVQSEYGATYAYRPGEPATFPMTAEALLCRQYLGWRRTDDRLVTGVHQISTTPIDWSDKNVYYWYYATQVMHHMEGDAWEEWNSVLRQVIPTHQTKDGPEAGSWSPSGDRWGGQGGRLYTTCFCIYMLEVYYRHLPIYSNAFR